MMVSQPRRITARSLMKRLQSTLVGEHVGLRMGQGVREENDQTKIWFVTSGYLVQYLSHTIQSQSLTHLIIDEVHERSLDGDLCCYLARQLSLKNPHLRIVLMSATLDANLYRDYFTEYQQQIDDIDNDISCEVETLFVGVKRFPIEIYYIEELLVPTSMSNNESNDKIRNLLQCCETLTQNENKIPPPHFIKLQYEVAIHIIRTIPNLGTAVLVFVAGIADIDYFVDYFEGLERYNVICVHSQIPLEEQEAIFQPALPSEIKVIIATNAAESSITLPDVETVICLGYEKLLTYNDKYHRVELIPNMISQASAKQRAGRTGRVGPGQVFRLYTKTLFESFREHSEGEVLRVPLHDMILKLRGIMEKSLDFNGVIPILADLPDPPNLNNLRKSFEYLFESGLITEPSDEGKLSIPGKFLSQLPVSLRLGRFLVYAIFLGFFEEATIIAAALQLPKTPFRLPSPYIVKDPAIMNSWRQKVFLLMTKFDQGSYSEPIMLLKIYLTWEKIPSDERLEWCKKNYLDMRSMRMWSGSVKEIKNRILNVLSYDQQSNLENIAYPKTTLWNLIRICIVWCAEDNLLKLSPPSKKMKTYNQQMSIAAKDSKYFPHILNLIPPDLKYNVSKTTFFYKLNILFVDILQHSNLNEIIETFFKFSQNNFQFSIFCYRLEDDYRVNFFVKEENKEIPLKYFNAFDFSKCSAYDLGDGWILIEISNPTKNQVQSLCNPLKITIPHLIIIFDDKVNYTQVKTNTQLEILEELFFIWNQNVSSNVIEERNEFNNWEIYFCDPNPSINLIDDVPLGIRLFNFLIRGYKDR